MPLFGSNPSGPADRVEGETTPSHSSIFHTPNTKNTPSTIIAKGVKLEGEFKSQGDVLIDGEVVGNIQTDGLLNVGPEAYLKAGVVAADAVIAGKVEGNLQVKRRLEIKATAKTKGDIQCQTIVVEAGAMMMGNIKCGETLGPQFVSTVAQFVVLSKAESSKDQVAAK